MVIGLKGPTLNKDRRLKEGPNQENQSLHPENRSYIFWHEIVHQTLCIPLKRHCIGDQPKENTVTKGLKAQADFTWR